MSTSGAPARRRNACRPASSNDPAFEFLAARTCRVQEAGTSVEYGHAYARVSTSDPVVRRRVRHERHVRAERPPGVLRRGEILLYAQACQRRVDHRPLRETACRTEAQGCGSFGQDARRDLDRRSRPPSSGRRRSASGAKTRSRRGRDGCGGSRAPRPPDRGRASAQVAGRASGPRQQPRHGLRRRALSIIAGGPAPSGSRCSAS